jgi:hypothetical protein
MEFKFYLPVPYDEGLAKEPLECLHTFFNPLALKGWGDGV